MDAFVPAELVEPAYRKWVFEEPVAGSRGFQLVVGEDFKRQVELEAELIMPLFGQHSWANNQAAVQIAAHQQLLDQESSHDGLASARVVSQEEAQRLPRQHFSVDPVIWCGKGSTNDVWIASKGSKR